MRAGVVGVPRSMKFGYLMGHGLKVLNGGWKAPKQSARINIRVVGSVGMLDLTCMTCGSSGTDGSSSASLVDVMPGSVFIGDLFTAGSMLIKRDVSDCRVRNVLPDMVEVPESPYIDGSV